jgi:hypothetical protein
MMETRVLNLGFVNGGQLFLCCFHLFLERKIQYASRERRGGSVDQLGDIGDFLTLEATVKLVWAE